MAVDRIGRALEGRGLPDHLVEIGGEVRARGTRARGGAWRVAVEGPGEGGAAAVVLLDGALATSGSYRNHYLLDGAPVSHTIDPRTGRPIEHGLVSVSVSTSDAPGPMPGRPPSTSSVRTRAGGSQSTRASRSCYS